MSVRIFSSAIRTHFTFSQNACSCICEILCRSSKSICAIWKNRRLIADSSASMATMRKPFDDKMSAASKSGLCLLSAEMVINPDISYTTWREKKDKEGIDDREEFARMLKSAHRNWSNSTFMKGLSDSRSQEEKKKIVDEFYDSVEKRISKMSPEEFKDDVRLIYLVIRKE